MPYLDRLHLGRSPGLAPGFDHRCDLVVDSHERQRTTGLATTREFLALVAGEPTLRVTETGEPFRTDQGNVIFDCHTGAIEDVFSLAGVLEAHAGIVEHGLFLGLTQFLVVASSTGVEILSPS